MACALGPAAAQVEEAGRTPLQSVVTERAPVFLSGRLVGDVSIYISREGDTRLHLEQLRRLTRTDLTVLGDASRPGGAEPFISISLNTLLANGFKGDLRRSGVRPQLWLSYLGPQPFTPLSSDRAPSSAPAKPPGPLGQTRQMAASLFVDGKPVGNIRFENSPADGLKVDAARIQQILRRRGTWPIEASVSSQPEASFLAVNGLKEMGYRLGWDAATDSIKLDSISEPPAVKPEIRLTASPNDPAPQLPQLRRTKPDEADAAMELSSATLQPGKTAPSRSAQAAAAHPDFDARSIINPTGRAINMFVPLRLDGRYHTDVEVFISADAEISVRRADILQAIGDQLSEGAVAQLGYATGADGMIDLDDPVLDRIQFSYDPYALELTATLSADARQARSISVANLERRSYGEVETPASTSGYLNLRTAFDFIHSGGTDGFTAPLIDGELAFRTRGLVFETEFLADFSDTASSSFVRRGSRIVYDDVEQANRWILGDVRPVTSGLQASRNTFGLSLFRSFSRLQPQRVVRPRGRTSFSLTEPSSVDVIVNNRVVRTLDLGAGQFDLNDFPFLIGENNVQIVAEDSLGRREAASFDLYFDRSLLEPGLSEYAATLGVAAETTGPGLDYMFDQPVFSGFYRRGINNALAVGGKLQADLNVVVAGLEAIWGSGFGTLRFDGALSSFDGGRTGYGLEVDFERNISGTPQSNRRLLFSAAAFGEDFALLGDRAPQNPIAYRIGASYGQSLGPKTSITANAEFVSDRLRDENFWSTGLRLSRQVGRYTSLSFDAAYEYRDDAPEFGFMFTISRRFGRNQLGRASYDSFSQRSGLNYSRTSPRRVDALSWNTDVDVSPEDAGVNADVYYVMNRAELGLSHLAGFGLESNEVTNQRTSLRMATAVAFADGAFALSRPVSDSFAIVEPHTSLAGSQIYVNPRERGDADRSGTFGGAVVLDIGSYSQRTLTVDVSDLPVGYDLGAGAFSVLPPYKSGYRLTVGSDNSVSVVGTATDMFGEPVILVSGRVTPVNRQFKEAIPVFTNSTGRFSASGLGPGDWMLELNTSPPLRLHFNIPDETKGYLELGPMEAMS